MLSFTSSLLYPWNGQNSVAYVCGQSKNEMISPRCTFWIETGPISLLLFCRKRICGSATTTFQSLRSLIPFGIWWGKSTCVERRWSQMLTLASSGSSHFRYQPAYTYCSVMRIGCVWLTYRRIVGIAHVEDLESIADTSRRAYCERRALEFAKTLVKERRRFHTIEEVTAALASLWFWEQIQTAERVCDAQKIPHLLRAQDARCQRLLWWGWGEVVCALKTELNGCLGHLQTMPFFKMVLYYSTKFSSIREIWCPCRRLPHMVLLDEVFKLSQVDFFLPCCVLEGLASPLDEVSCYLGQPTSLNPGNMLARHDGTEQHASMVGAHSSSVLVWWHGTCVQWHGIWAPQHGAWVQQHRACVWQHGTCAQWCSDIKHGPHLRWDLGMVTWAKSGTNILSVTSGHLDKDANA